MDKKLPLLILLAAFPPLSTDMYLAALPVLQKQYNQPFSIVNLTLVLFFVSYCLFMLIYGPLSDRFGRRPILIIGTTIYTLGSFMCSFAPGIYSLILFRIIQAAGGASASVLSMAICKDIYDGVKREKILAYIAIITAIAPMIGPVVGGYIMTYFTWHYVFVIQGILGCIALAGSIGLTETLTRFTKVKIVQMSSSYFSLFKNSKYMLFVVICSISVFPFFAFIGGSSDIYIIGFGVSKEAFGYYFALNAVGAMIGALCCSKLVDKIGSNDILSIGFTGTFIAGMLLFIFADGPNLFALFMFIFSMFIGFTRPSITNKVLNQVERNAGVASSLMMVMYFLLGSFGMWLISLDWASKVNVLGAFCLVAEGFVIIAWFSIQLLKRFKSE
ncbi:MAG TPA: multidrug effflux MFS transporter [Victivallales bacterium]|nr:multidrug effflux MFS transporter [Victivallales bacterium]